MISFNTEADSVPIALLINPNLSERKIESNPKLLLNIFARKEKIFKG